MKIFKINLFISFVTLIIMTNCEDPLEEEIFSQLAPSTLLITEDGITTVLNSAYSYAHWVNNSVARWAYYMNDFAGGSIWGKGGSIESWWTGLTEFTWNSTHLAVREVWPNHYRAIRDANVVLDNLNQDGLNSSFVTLTTAESKFIRGWSYSQLYNLYGPVPIHTSGSDDALKPRASDSEIIAQIENDLLESINGLPETTDFGKGTKGAAMGILTKHYLNTKQWQKALDMAKNIINSGHYALQPTFQDVFSFENEGNNEMIWALPKHSGSGNQLMALQSLTYPPNYPRPYSNNAVWAARTYLFDSFIDSFEEGDERLISTVQQWSTSDGTPQNAYGYDQTFPAKFPFDANSLAWRSGNDTPIVRYSDILISAAEAINEISGPTQEAIDLINQVRERAKISLLSLGDFNKESFRAAVIQERRWEFFHEGKTREYLLRHDLFISDAISRGKDAKPHHKLYPIPQSEIDANDLLTQNPGY